MLVGDTTSLFELAKHRSVITARQLLLLPMLVFASITVLTHAARVFDVQFKLYALACLTGTLVMVAVWIRLWLWERKTIEVADWKTLALVLGIGLIGAGMASIYRFPDSDDYMMGPDAVHFITHTGDVMSNEVHYLVPAGEKIYSVVNSTSSPFEYSQALAALLTRIPFLDFYYIITVAFVGFAVPVSLYLLVSHFASDSRTAAAATLVAVAVLSLLGETKYAPGAMSFARLFQGKSVLLAAGLPFFLALSLNFLGLGAFRRWFYVAAAATALAGLSSTAFFIVPMSALALGGAYTTVTGVTPGSVRRMAIYGAGVLYPVVYGLYASRSVASLRDASNWVMQEWPGDFTGHLALMIDPVRPVTPVVFIVSMALTASLLCGLRRRLLLIWVGLAFLVFLNPAVAPFWMRTATSNAIYWRVFYVVPLMAAVGAVAVRLIDFYTPLPRRSKIIIGFGAALVMVGLHLIPHSPSIYRRGGDIGWPAYKLHGEPLAVARRIVEDVPPGPMLAPPDVAGTIGLLQGGYPQVHLRGEPLRMWLPWSESERRYAATRYAEGDMQAQQAFVDTVERLPDLRVVVIRTSVLPNVAALLETRGFNDSTAEGDFTILWKQGHE